MAHSMWGRALYGGSEMDFVRQRWPIVEELRVIHLHHWPPLQSGLCPSLSTAFNWFQRPWMGRRWLEASTIGCWEPTEYVLCAFYSVLISKKNFTGEQKRIYLVRDIAQLQGFRATNVIAFSEVLLLFQTLPWSKSKPEDKPFLSG